MGRNLAPRSRQPRGRRKFPLGPLALSGQGAQTDAELAASAILSPGTTHNPEAPARITPDDARRVAELSCRDLARTRELDELAARELCDCLTAAVVRGNSFSDRALDYYVHQGVQCLLLHLDLDQAEQHELADQVRGALETHSARWRSKGHNLRGGIARVPRRRAPAKQRPDLSAGASCGSKRKDWKVDPGLATRLAWLAKNCGGGKTRAKGNPTGGSLPAARRAAGLWDRDQPIDEEARHGQAQPGHISGEINHDYTPAFQATSAAHALSPDGLSTFRASDWGAAARLGYSPCQTPGSGMSCFDPASGLDRRWTVTGRHFTKDEQATFYKTHCTPSCDAIPITRGAPADAKVGIRRVAPRNPAVRARLNCAPQRSLAPFSRLALRPLPALGASPQAILPKPACVPDTVIGVDGGMFGSGWWIVIRNGQRLLVPNPELCGAAPPTF